ncbi:glycosyl hydrolase [Streptomyces sp. NPDC004096]|uniref:glycosyl hydrolase n=1 Tax=unclassified Streptomyces TaxID=2593676 RepID=UPI0033B7E2B3
MSWKPSSVPASGEALFEVGDRMPSGPVVSCSPQWFDLMNRAVSEAHGLGLDLTLHNCSDWSSTGTVWVTPALSIRQMLWNETFVAGGKAVDVRLPRTLVKKE